MRASPTRWRRAAGRVADRKVATFSRGMRQRLGLAEMVLKGARVAILDEPTSGLDPQSTHEFLDLIRGLKERGVAVLLSSHLLERVQTVCDRVFLFHKGRIVLQGGVPRPRARDAGRRLQHPGRGRRRRRLRRATRPRRASLEIATMAMAVTAIAAEARPARRGRAPRSTASGVRLQRLNVMEPSLDDIYARYFDKLRTAA